MTINEYKQSLKMRFDQLACMNVPHIWIFDNNSTTETNKVDPLAYSYNGNTSCRAIKPSDMSGLWISDFELALKFATVRNFSLCDTE